MASVSLSLTIPTQPPGPAPAQQGSSAGPEASASQAQGVASQQDTVTLAGRAAESQPQRGGGGNGSFGEASSYFLAERQSFRASSGSAPSQSSGASTPPTLPVKLSSNVGQSEDSVGDDEDSEALAGSANDAISAATATESDGGAASGVANNAALSTAAAGANSQTPFAELTQLDQTLQQIGINPQSISLFNRMAMLLYANDPAALKVLMQTLQTGAQVSSGGASTATAGGAGALQVSAATVQSLLPAEPEGGSAPSSNSQAQVSQDAGVEASDQNAAPPFQGFTAQQMQQDAQVAATESTSSDGSSDVSFPLAQMQGLQQALVSVGAQSPPGQGEMLDVNA